MSVSGPSAIGLRTSARTLATAASAGAVLAVLVVYAYYNDPWRALAHVLGPWAVLAAMAGFGRPPRLAAAAGVTSLAAAVVTFYVGLKVGHDLRWADAGSTMTIDWDKIQLWLIFAVPAGAVLGLLGFCARRAGGQGAAASAALLGLLLGEAYRRYTGYGPDVAVLVDVVLAAAVFVVTVRRNGRPVLTLALAAVAAVAGFLVVSAPDFLEQILLRL